MNGNIDEEKLLQVVKKVVLGLVALAILVFLVLSIKIFTFSTQNRTEFSRNYRNLSRDERSVISTMRKTGELQSSFWGPTRSTGGNGKFLDEVERRHRDDRKFD